MRRRRFYAALDGKCPRRAPGAGAFTAVLVIWINQIVISFYHDNVLNGEFKKQEILAVLTEKMGALPSLFSALVFTSTNEYQAAIPFSSYPSSLPLSSPPQPAPLDTISTCNQFRLNDCFSLSPPCVLGPRPWRSRGRVRGAHWRSISSSITKNCSAPDITYTLHNAQTGRST